MGTRATKEPTLGEVDIIGEGTLPHEDGSAAILPRTSTLSVFGFCFAADMFLSIDSPMQ